MPLHQLHCTSLPLYPAACVAMPRPTVGLEFEGRESLPTYLVYTMCRMSFNPKYRVVAHITPLLQKKLLLYYCYTELDMLRVTKAGLGRSCVPISQHFLPSPTITPACNERHKADLLCDFPASLSRKGLSLANNSQNVLCRPALSAVKLHAVDVLRAC